MNTKIEPKLEPELILKQGYLPFFFYSMMKTIYFYYFIKKNVEGLANQIKHEESDKADLINNIHEKYLFYF